MPAGELFTSTLLPKLLGRAEKIQTYYAVGDCDPAVNTLASKIGGPAHNALGPPEADLVRITRAKVFLAVPPPPGLAGVCVETQRPGRGVRTHLQGTQRRGDPCRRRKPGRQG